MTPTAGSAPAGLVRPPHVVVVGDVVTDVVAVLAGDLAPGSDAPARITTTGGGSAANTAVWLARLGQRVTLVAVVGADAAGPVRCAELDTEGVRLAVRVVPDADTGTVIVLTGAHDRSMINDRGANLRLSRADVDAGLADAGPTGTKLAEGALPETATAATVPADAAGPTHLHLSGYPLLDAASRDAARYALSAAMARGMTVSVGAGSAAPLRRAGAAAFLSWIRGADLLIANMDEAGALLDNPVDPPAPARPGGDRAGPGGGATRDGDDRTALARPAAAAVRLAAMLDAGVVVTCGAHGAVWAGPDGSAARIPAPPVPVVDPTGAGDSFTAGLLARWLTGGGPADSLAAGVRLAAGVVSVPGARPGLSRPN